MEIKAKEIDKFQISCTGCKSKDIEILVTDEEYECTCTGACNLIIECNTCAEFYCKPGSLV